MHVDVEVESLTGSVKKTVSVSTAEKVTGNLEVTDWGRHAGKWPHLKCI